MFENNCVESLCVIEVIKFEIDLITNEHIQGVKNWTYKRFTLLWQMSNLSETIARCGKSAGWIYRYPVRQQIIIASKKSNINRVTSNRC